MKKYLGFILLFSIVGCAASNSLPPITKHRIVNVEVPIYVKAPMPDEIVRVVKFEKPVFVSPDDVNASSALTEEGERSLKKLFILIRDSRKSVRVWNATQ